MEPVQDIHDEPDGGTRMRARRWWGDTARRAVSTRFEARETAYFAHAVTDEVLRHVRAPVRAVLDIGCGPGRVLAAAAARRPGTRLIGIDPDPASLAEARHRLGGTPGVTLLEAHAEDLVRGRLGVVDGPVDAAVVLLTIALWTDRIGPLRAVLDRLAPRGVLLVLDLIAPVDEPTRATWSGFAAGRDEAEYLGDQMAAWPGEPDYRELATDLARHPRAARVRLATCALHDVGVGEPPWESPPFGTSPRPTPTGPRAALLLAQVGDCPTRA